MIFTGLPTMPFSLYQSTCHHYLWINHCSGQVLLLGRGLALKQNFIAYPIPDIELRIAGNDDPCIILVAIQHLHWTISLMRPYLDSVLIIGIDQTKADHL